MHGTLPNIKITLDDDVSLEMANKGPTRTQVPFQCITQHSHPSLVLHYKHNRGKENISLTAAFVVINLQFNRWHI